MRIREANGEGRERGCGMVLRRAATSALITLVFAAYDGVMASRAVARPAAGARRLYALNLRSTFGAAQTSVRLDPKIAKRYGLYRTRFKKGGKTWNRLRLGFFPSIAEAKRVRRLLESKFPGAWIAQVSEAEREAGLAQGAKLPQPSPEQVARAPVRKVPPPAPRRDEVPAKRPSARVPKAAPKRVTKVPPPAPVRKVPAPSRRERKPSAERARRAVPKVADVTPGRPAPPPVADDSISELVERARRAMVDRDYALAIRLYTHLLEYPEVKQEALEYLGLARERKGQTAHAKAEYEEYLRLYPEGEGAGRVRQRLAALVTAPRRPKEKLKPSKREERDEFEFKTFGSFSQMYRRHQEFSDTEGSAVDLSTVFTNLDVASELSNSRYDFRTEFAGDLDVDILEEGDGEEGSITSMFAEATDRGKDRTIIVGRQSRSTDGVLGRFDGGVVGYRVLPKWRINILGGFPVDFSALDDFRTEKFFYGVSLDAGTFAGRWDTNLFFINQEVDGITDRRSIGGEVRYFHQGASMFSLLDYDVLYNELNTFLVTGNLFFESGATVNGVFDYRKSPILTTSNALQGLGAESIDELLEDFTEERIRELARDRTATSTLATIGASYPLSDRFQIGGDFSVSDLSDTEASEGVPATEGTDVELSYQGQITGQRLLMKRDLSTLSVRYTDASRQDVVSLRLNSRYPLGRSWRIRPRVRVDYRMFEENDPFTEDRQLILVSPTLQVEARFVRQMTLEVEAGLEWSDELGPAASDEELGFLLNAGYRWDF